MKGCSTKALSSGEDIPHGELFQRRTSDGTVLRSMCSTDVAAVVVVVVFRGCSLASWALVSYNLCGPSSGGSQQSPPY